MISSLTSVCQGETSLLTTGMSRVPPAITRCIPLETFGELARGAGPRHRLLQALVHRAVGRFFEQAHEAVLRLLQAAAGKAQGVGHVARGGAVEEAAADAIASVVGDDELSADYIVPSIFDDRIVERVAAAVSAAAIRDGVSRNPQHV